MTHISLWLILLQAIKLNNISLMRIPIFSYALSNVRMKTIYDIHRENLAILKEEAGGVGRLAEKLERAFAQTSQWLNGSKNSKTGKPRGMNSKTCRHIEAKCDKPKGWMDKSHSDVAAPNGTATTTDEILELISLYGRADQPGKIAILRAARSAASVDALLDAPADDQSQNR